MRLCNPLILFIIILGGCDLFVYNQPIEIILIGMIFKGYSVA